MVGTTGSLVSFAETEELLRTLAFVEVGAKQGERAAEALGREIDADERAVIDFGSPISTRMHLGIDGTGLPMRGIQLAGRTGKQPDGTARTREAKLVTIWSGDGGPGGTGWILVRRPYRRLLLNRRKKARMGLETSPRS